jgi:alpha-D-ribose 1-methylphosphonate 5-phosphate C-P lyase
MRRWHEETALMLRRHVEKATSFEGAQVPLGRLRKHPAHGCGRARCGLCHPSKRWPRQGRDDRRREIDHELRVA